MRLDDAPLSLCCPQNGTEATEVERNDCKKERRKKMKGNDCKKERRKEMKRNECKKGRNEKKETRIEKKIEKKRRKGGIYASCYNNSC